MQLTGMELTPDQYAELQIWVVTRPYCGICGLRGGFMCFWCHAEHRERFVDDALARLDRLQLLAILHPRDKFGRFVREPVKQVEYPPLRLVGGR